MPRTTNETDQGDWKRWLQPWDAQQSVVSDGDTIAAEDIIGTLQKLGAAFVLLESGPQLTGEFLAESALDELFLTVAPQIAGRNDSSKRPGLVKGHVFAPDDPRWAALVSVR